MSEPKGYATTVMVSKTIDGATGARLVPLYRLAHARSGDKGNRVSIGVFCWRQADYHLLENQLTEQRVQALFTHRAAQQVQRYLLPHLGAFNFVIDGVLQGGVNGSLNLDGHGKTLSFRLLECQIELPVDHWLCAE